MYEVVLANSAKKALKKLFRSGSFNEAAFEELMIALSTDEFLPTKYKDHQLHGSLSHLRECHLAFDLLVEYERDENLRIVTIVAIGTHDDLFSKGKS